MFKVPLCSLCFLLFNTPSLKHPIRQRNILIAHYACGCENIHVDKKENLGNVNWAKLDWRKQNAALARELNVPRQLVARWRAKLHKPQSPRHGVMPPRLSVDWDKVDWSQQNVVLADQLGTRAHTIAKWRRKLHAPDAANHGKWRNPPNSRYSWEKVDWKLQDCQIADNLGTYPSTVAKWRERLGKPRSPNYHLHRMHPARERWSKLNWKLQDIVLAEQTGLTRERIRQLRILFKAPKSPKHKIMRPRKPKAKKK